MDRATGGGQQGCGPRPPISVHVSPTTGGDFQLIVEPDATVDGLKRLVSKRLKVPRDRICLLFRDKQLLDGSLEENGVQDGARVTLLPNVETGLITQRPEIGIMQALESLNDTQVNEFLCGKAPLNLSMRLGDHMMLIQLQLSTVSGTKPPVVAGPPPPTSPPSLLQASRNLQHTLRRLSADVFSGRDKGRRESVYSGTFSGALNPALQDPKGRPRRDVATIVHILNDLLCSVPEFRRVGRRSSPDDATSSSSSSASSSASSTVSSISSSLSTPPSPPSTASFSSISPPSPPLNDEGLLDTSPCSSTSNSIISNNSNSNNSVEASACNEDQNLRTRGKLEHLRLVMGERRERRRQRKQKPYTLPSQSDGDTVTA